MTELRIKRSDILKHPNVCKEGLDVFDAVVLAQNNGTPDAIFPDGWTQEHSAHLHDLYPVFHDWLVLHKLIPNHTVERRSVFEPKPQVKGAKAPDPAGLKLPALKPPVIDKKPRVLHGERIKARMDRQQHPGRPHR